MDILYFFESIRTPVADAFFSAVTFLGHELIPIALICILYWCVNKKLAYKIGFSFFLSGLAVQCLKITFRVPRPWIKDPSFKPVGNAVDEATSYSFPSGHTQAATSLYASLAMTVKRKWLKGLCILAFVIVGISRMYLGVHTLADVGVSMALTLVLTVLIFKFTDFFYDNRRSDVWVFILMTAVSLFTIIYAAIMQGKAIISHDAAGDCVKAGAAGLAFAIGYFVERRYIDFDVSCPLKWQFIKVLAGLGVALGLKSGLKYIVGVNLLGDGIRYFILVAFIIMIYPAILKRIKNQRGC